LTTPFLNASLEVYASKNFHKALELFGQMLNEKTANQETVKKMLELCEKYNKPEVTQIVMERSKEYSIHA
jgi:hypothetical protein